jgi:hypothetical protein
MILFYAASGFLATHADWLIGEDQTSVEQDLRAIPADVITNDAAREAWCRNLLGPDAQVERGIEDALEQWYLVRGERRALQCVINSETLQVRIIPLQIIADSAPADHGQLSEHIAME